VLAGHGLAAAVQVVVERCRVPVDLDIADVRYAAEVEWAVYRVVDVALACAAAQGATRARVDVYPRGRDLRFAVFHDAGCTGLPDAAAGPVRALGGRVRTCHRDGGTLIDGRLPVPEQGGNT